MSIKKTNNERTLHNTHNLFVIATGDHADTFNPSSSLSTKLNRADRANVSDVRILVQRLKSNGSSGLEKHKVCLHITK